jgi:crotonobetaine/carnitine-CoA ligase
MLDNCVEQILLILACGKIGAIHVPLNTAFKGSFLRHQIADSGASVLIADSDYVHRILEVESGLPEAKVLFVKGPLPEGVASGLDIRPIKEALDGSDEPTGFIGSPSDVAMLIYTSGTTGPSKGCMLSSNNVCNVARQIVWSRGYKSTDVIWTPLPGFHLGMYTVTMLGTLMAGARCSIFPRFSVSKFWPEIERTGATAASILSSMITLIADMPENEAMKRCYGQLRAVIGAPFPPEVQETWRRRYGLAPGHGSTGYGLTEACLVTNCKTEEAAPPNSSGRRFDDFDVMIVDDQDRELPPGIAGEIVVRPRKPHIMFEGYWRRPEATTALMKNMWFHTGDVGKFDEAGWFYFVDRKKDYLRRRGENISSIEVEAAFLEHPAIAEVAVHAVFADAEDDVKVTAVLADGAELTEYDLCTWCADRLPYFAVPRFIEFRSSLPKNAVGRILKYELREEGKTAATWDREASDFQLVKR